MSDVQLTEVHTFRPGKLDLARDGLPRYTGMPIEEIARGALLLVSDVPLTPDGVKTATLP